MDYMKEANEIAERLMMKKKTAASRASNKDFPPINSVVSFTLTTEEAAFYLMRKAQTLRIWSCTKNGPIEPIHIFGRLAWKTSDVKRLLGIEE